MASSAATITIIVVVIICIAASVIYYFTTCGSTPRHVVITSTTENDLEGFGSRGLSIDRGIDSGIDSGIDTSMSTSTHTYGGMRTNTNRNTSLNAIDIDVPRLSPFTREDVGLREACRAYCSQHMRKYGSSGIMTSLNNSSLTNLSRLSTNINAHLTTQNTIVRGGCLLSDLPEDTASDALYRCTYSICKAFHDEGVNLTGGDGSSFIELITSSLKASQTNMLIFKDLFEKIMAVYDKIQKRYRLKYGTPISFIMGIIGLPKKLGETIDSFVYCAREICNALPEKIPIVALTKLSILVTSLPTKVVKIIHGFSKADPNLSDSNIKALRELTMQYITLVEENPNIQNNPTAQYIVLAVVAVSYAVADRSGKVIVSAATMKDNVKGAVSIVLVWAWNQLESFVNEVADGDTKPLMELVRVTFESSLNKNSDWIDMMKLEPQAKAFGRRIGELKRIEKSGDVERIGMKAGEIVRGLLTGNLRWGL